jgi:hypothetical protein
LTLLLLAVVGPLVLALLLLVLRLPLRILPLPGAFAGASLACTPLLFVLARSESRLRGGMLGFEPGPFRSLARGEIPAPWRRSHSR